jgi:hypothetical protein
MTEPQDSELDLRVLRPADQRPATWRPRKWSCKGYGLPARPASPSICQSWHTGKKPKRGGGPSRKVAQEFVAADHARGKAKLPKRAGLINR